MRDIYDHHCGFNMQILRDDDNVMLLERKQDDQKLRMRRFREEHEHTAEDS